MSELRTENPPEVLTVYGTTWCPDCKRSKQFLGDQRVRYQWVNIEQDPEAMAYVEQINNGKRIVPTIICPNGTILVEPSNAELAAEMGLKTQAERTFYDLVIVGAGPAGLTAAIYAAREKQSTLVIEKGAPGGQAGVTQLIDNYPGFDEGISGDEFAARLTRQARRFGVEILPAQEVTSVGTNGQYREVVTSDGSRYGASAVLIATGAHYRRLDVPGESELIGVNLHFCATCDGPFYKGKDVMVIGGGNSAFEESLYLSRLARRVLVLVRATQIRASPMLQEMLTAEENVTIYTNHAVQEFLIEDGKLAAVRVVHLDTGEQEDCQADGVFVFVGVSPNSGFLSDEFDRDRAGFLLTGSDFQSSVRGVFVAGDVRAGATSQAAAAAGEGVTAALMIRDYLRKG